MYSAIISEKTIKLKEKRKRILSLSLEKEFLIRVKDRCSIIHPPPRRSAKNK